MYIYRLLEQYLQYVTSRYSGSKEAVVFDGCDNTH